MQNNKNIQGSVGFKFLFTVMLAVGFSWLPNNETDLAGYKLHIGDATGVYTQTIDCGLPETVDGRVKYTLNDSPDGDSFYALTAYDTNGNESEYSNELNDDANPNSPGGFTKVEVDVNVNVNINQ